MIGTLKKIFGLKYAYRKNSIIYSLKQFPLIGKLFQNQLYGNDGVSALVKVLSGLIEVASFFLWKIPYLLFFIFFPLSIYQTDFETSFLLIFFFLSMIGMYMNTNMFNPSKDKYYAVKLMRMDAKKVALTEYTYFLFKTGTGLLFVGVILSFFFSVSWYLAILAPFMVIGLKIISTWYNLKKYQKTNKVFNENHPSILIWGWMILLLLLAYFVPNFTFPHLKTLMIILYLLVIVIGGFCYRNLYQFTDYSAIYKKLLTPEQMVVNAQEVRKEATQKSYLKSIDTKKTVSSQEVGYGYFNDIFMKRHRKILTHSAHQITFVLVVVSIIMAILLIFVDDVSKPVNQIILEWLPYFSFLMYLINRGMTVTQAMFMNCDHSMLTYRFYRQPKAILELFRRRLKSIILINLEPAIVIACALPILLYLSGGTANAVNYIVLFVTIIAMSIFFSVHYLVIYYLLQPYNLEMEMKNPLYNVISGFTYFACYWLMQLKMPTIIFGSVVSVFALLYIIVALILAYRYAPKTFKLK